MKTTVMEIVLQRGGVQTKMGQKPLHPLAITLTT